MSFSQEAYVNPVFTKGVIQLHLSAARAIRVPAGQPYRLALSALGCTAIFSYKVDNNYQDSPRSCRT
jgi:hypothetical protein